MLKSIYTPVSGALTQERVLEILSNNLANVNTTGFKGDKVSFQALLPEPNKHYNNPLPPANYKFKYEEITPLVGNEVSHVGVADIKRDVSQGPAIRTQNQEDLMIEGDGFLQVQTRDGERFTRNGALSINPDGVLTSNLGDPVMGAKGTIYLEAGKFDINPRGEIYQDGEMIDRLLLYKFDDATTLERAGKSYYLYGGSEEGKTQIKDPAVMQGYLEGSNVNAIQNLTAMIVAHRSYEAYQKAVSNYDTMMEKSSNALGEVRA